MQIAQYVTYSMFSGKEPTLDEQRSILQKLDSRQVLAFCSTIGILLQLWGRQGAEPAAYRGLIRRFFKPEIAALLIAQFPAFQVFSRRQLLAIERLAIETYQVQKEPRESYYDFGTLALMINDHLHYGLAGTEVEDEKVMRNLFVEMIPITEDAGSSIFAKTARFTTLIEEIAPLLNSHPDFLDIEAAFRDVTGIALSEFQASCAAMLTKWVQFDVSQQTPPMEIFLTEGWFDSTALHRTTVQSVLNLLSADVNFYVDAFSGRAKRREDLTPFRERPLLSIGSVGYLPSDLTLLAEAFESLPFWTVNKRIASSKKPDQLFGFWGAMFETYLGRITRAAANPHLHECFEGPVFERNGEQVCDLLIRCGSELVLIEAKGAMITREAKYSGDVDTCFKEIERKFVHNEKGKNKGVSQLEASIRRIFAEKAPVAGIDLTGIIRVFPVVVSMDSIGENPLFSNVLNCYFDAKSLSQACALDIQSVLGVGIESYEFMTGYMATVSLASVLSDWLENPPTPNWIGAFSMVDTPLTRSLREKRNPYIAERFTKATSRIARALFPKLSSDPGGNMAVEPSSS